MDQFTIRVDEIVGRRI